MHLWLLQQITPELGLTSDADIQERSLLCTGPNRVGTVTMESSTLDGINPTKPVAGRAAKGKKNRNFASHFLTTFPRLRLSLRLSLRAGCVGISRKSNHCNRHRWEQSRQAAWVHANERTECWRSTRSLARDNWSAFGRTLVTRAPIHRSMPCIRT